MIKLLFLILISLIPKIYCAEDPFLPQSGYGSCGSNYEPGVNIQIKCRKQLTISRTDINGKEVILYQNSLLEKVKERIESQDQSMICIKSYNSWSKKTRVVTINTRTYHVKETIYDHDVQVSFILNKVAIQEII